MSMRSVVTPTRNFYKPRPDPMDQLCQDLERLRQHMRNCLDGGHMLPPTTPSSQGSGAAGSTTWYVDIAPMVVVVDGVQQHFDAQTDFLVWAVTTLVQINEECVAAIVAKNVSGTVSLVAVTGTVAGSAVGPTDAQIEAVVGASNEWVRVGETKIRRTADITLVQTYNSTARPLLGVNTDQTFGDWTFVDTYLTEKLKSV